MNTIKLNNIEIPLTEENIRLMREAVGQEKKSYKPWMGKIGESYWRVDSFRYLVGNYFQTKDDAETHLNRTKAISRVTHAIIEANEGWVPDWGNDREPKYSIYYMTFHKSFGFLSNSRHKECIVIPYCKNEDIALQIIKDHEADLKIIFGI